MAKLLDPGVESAGVSPALGSWKSRVRTVAGAIAKGCPVFPFGGGDARASEQYRIVRTKIVQHARRPRMLAVSSPEVGDGKSVTALNLAGALALKNELDVLLVDADLRRSSLAAMLDIPSAPGLVEVLRGECALEEAVVRVALKPSICVLPSGGKTLNATELFDSIAWRQTCAEILREFAFIIIDTTPVGIVADYELVQSVVDGVILVVRPDHTSRTHCYDALQVVSREKLIGVVLNCVPDWFVARYSYGYDYYRVSE